MKINNTNKSYGLISIAFHWIMALLFLVTFILGKRLENSFMEYDLFLMLHNSCGILIFILAILRLIWRLLNPTPNKISSERILKYLSNTVFIFFYILMFAIPITGYLMMNFNNELVSFFSQPVFMIFNENKILFREFKDLHELLGDILLVLLFLHVSAALFHHFILKDETLKRIVIFKKK